MRDFILGVMTGASITVGASAWAQPYNYYNPPSYQEQRNWDDVNTQFYNDTHSFSVPAYQPTVNCYSYVVGGTIYTSCN